MELLKNPENLSITSMKYLYQYCVNNIPRVRETLVPLTDETIIAYQIMFWNRYWTFLMRIAKKLFVKDVFLWNR